MQDHRADHQPGRFGRTRSSEADLARHLGSAVGQYAETTVLDLILHIQAEALQRGANLCQLRDFYWHLQRGRI